MGGKILTSSKSGLNIFPSVFVCPQRSPSPTSNDLYASVQWRPTVFLQGDRHEFRAIYRAAAAIPRARARWREGVHGRTQMRTPPGSAGRVGKVPGANRTTCRGTDGH